MAASFTSSEPAPLDAIAEAVLGAVRRVCEEEGLDAGRVEPAASLVHDLSMDSFTFVELAIALEEELGALDFPLQAWADDEATRPGPRYTIASLVEHAKGFLASRGSR